MAEGLPILYNSVVREIRYSSKGVAVRTDLHEFAGANGLQRHLRLPLKALMKAAEKAMC
jgi:hypothetical protein